MALNLLMSLLLLKNVESNKCVSQREQRMQKQTECLASGKPFSIVHPNGRAWSALQVSDNVWGKSSSMLTLEQGVKSFYSLSASDNQFEKDKGWLAIKNSATGDLVRHAGYVMWEQKFCGPDYDFSYKFTKGKYGFTISNPFDKGHVVGYDAVKDRVLIVKDIDSKNVEWNVECNEAPKPPPDASVEKMRLQRECMASGKPFSINHPNGKSWSTLPVSENHYGQSSSFVTLSRGVKSTYVLSESDNRFKKEQNWLAIKNAATQDLVRHLGFVMWEQKFCGPDHDFSYKFTEGKHGFIISNPFDNGHVVGYDAVKDRVLIVKEIDSKNVEWNVECNEAPKPPPDASVEKMRLQRECMASGKPFSINHPNGKSWSTLPVSENHYGQSSSFVTLSRGVKSTYVLSESDNRFKKEQNWLAIKNAATQDLVRHLGFVMWEQKFCGPDHDFSYKFTEGKHGFIISNPFDNGHVVGYDQVRDRVSIVRPTTQNIVEWVVACNNLVSA
jgi:hypothetical protein